MKFLFTLIFLALFTQALGLEFLQDTVIETSYWQEYCEERCGGTFQVGKNGGEPAIIDSILLGKANIPDEVEEFGVEITGIRWSNGIGFSYNRGETFLKFMKPFEYTHARLYDYKSLQINQCERCDFDKCRKEQKPVEVAFEAIFIYKEGGVKRDTVVFIGLACTGKYLDWTSVLHFERECGKTKKENFNAKGQVLNIHRNKRKIVFNKILK